jgi:hypothetical protein
MRATLTAKTIRHYDENGYVAYLEVVGGVDGGKLSRISSIGDRQYKNLSAICDRELARVGLAYQGGWGTDNGPEDSKGGTVWTYEIDEDEADEMTYVKARSVGTGERKEFTIKAAPISNIRQIVEAHAKAR